jgi:hypothetical protein
VAESVSTTSSATLFLFRTTAGLLSSFERQKPLAAAGATAGAVSTNGDFGCHLKTGAGSLYHIVHGNIFGGLVKILINNHGKLVYFKYLIRRFWFIQDHRKLRTASSTALEIDPDGGKFLTLKILSQNLFSFLRHMNHEILLSFRSRVALLLYP